MPAIGDRTSAPEDEIVLAPDMTGVYRLRDVQFTEAEQIGDPGQFPEHGYFLPMTRVSVQDAATDPSWSDGEDVLLETPLALEQALERIGASPGDVVSVYQPSKSEGGRWTMTVDGPVAPEDVL